MLYSAGAKAQNRLWNGNDPEERHIRIYVMQMVQGALGLSANWKYYGKPHKPCVHPCIT